MNIMKLYRSNKVWKSEIKENNGRQGKSGRKYIIIYLLYLMALVVLTLVFPDDVLVKIPFLNKWINIVSYWFDGVEGLGKYSYFPQVAQLIYSLEIITMPIITVILYQYFKHHLKMDTGLLRQRPIVAPIVMILLCPIALLSFYIFTVPPTTINNFPHRFLANCYHSKIWFVIGSALFLYLAMFIVVLEAIFIRDIFRLFKRNNTL